jgi:hypothetical protein
MSIINNKDLPLPGERITMRKLAQVHQVTEKLDKEDIEVLIQCQVEIQMMREWIVSMQVLRQKFDKDRLQRHQKKAMPLHQLSKNQDFFIPTGKYFFNFKEYSLDGGGPGGGAGGGIRDIRVKIRDFEGFYIFFKQCNEFILGTKVLILWLGSLRCTNLCLPPPLWWTKVVSIPKRSKFLMFLMIAFSRFCPARFFFVLFIYLNFCRRREFPEPTHVFLQKLIAEHE